ncbi:MAG: tRNA (guanosine(46)-N7)-methyltransferase TrmB [Clostridia bacterium]|jgi:tRNA (guanine-N7-)-methyltransferase|nr:tRNA (guanosine(46)-N7)-methyltransferase TrmB [Clostridia bacterium]
MRMRRLAGIDRKLEKLAGRIYFRPEEMKGRWAEVFGNDRPLHLELGSGKGSFLGGMALKYPDVNFLGLERVPEIIHKAANHPVVRERPNARLILADGEYLSYYFAEGEIARIYLNFSDPWPKKRHEQRRLTHPRFLELYQRILRPGGEIFLKTDSPDFLGFSLQSFVTCGYSLQKITRDLHKSAFFDNVLTEYEQKFSGHGQPICRLEAIAPFGE